MEVDNDRVMILAEIAEAAHDIDHVRAEAARDRAEERLHRLNDPTIDRERAQVALERAMIRLQVVAKSS